MDLGLNVVTQSRMGSWLACPRRHWFAYIKGLARTEESEPLTFGSMLHSALNEIKLGREVASVIFDMDIALAKHADDEKRMKWIIDIQCLVAAWVWRWRGHEIKYVSGETWITRPIEGYAGLTDSVILDGIVENPDGTLAIIDHKSTSESIEANGRFWMQLQHNLQVDRYISMARSAGIDTWEVLWDVIRRPAITIKKKQTPIEYRRELLADIMERPDFYFARKPIARSKFDIAESETEGLHILRHMLDMQDNPDPIAHYRCPGSCLLPYRCEFLEICNNATAIADGESFEGYHVKEAVHEELLKSTAKRIKLGGELEVDQKKGE